MKKALVMTFVLVLGLGLAAFAAGGLSGTLDISASFVPDASDFDDFVNSMSVTLEVDYTIAGWTFGSSTGFNLDGFSSQSFTAEGVLGAFSFESTMKFKPMAVTAEEYTYIGTGLAVTNATDVDTTDEYVTIDGVKYYPDAAAQSASEVLYDSCWWKDVDWLTKKTTTAEFDEWKASGSVSIAGVSLEGIFFLEGYAGAPDTKPYAFYWDGVQTASSTWFTAMPYATMTQTGSGVLSTYYYNIWDTDDEYIGGFTSTPTTTGSGFRFKVGGTAGGMTITSYTYFNLTEADATAACDACGYSFARKGTFKIANADCDVTFTEEYLTIEGLSFGCATVDVAVSIDCTGFSSLKVLINDFDLGFCCGGLTIDALLTFETTSKTFEITPCVTLADTCLTFEVALDWSSNEIAGLNIYGVSFEHTWNGITFTSKTAFDTDNSCLFGTSGKSVTDAANQILVMVPVTGLYTYPTEECSDGSCTATETHRPSILQSGKGYYTPWCIYTEKYVVWEAFSVEIDGDSCCGGAFDLTVDTYFGDKKLLNGFVWEYQFYDTSPAYDIDYTEVVDFDLSGVEDTKITKFATGDGPDDLSTDGLSTGEKYEEDLTKKAYYYNASEDTLFAWAQTDVDLEIGIGSAWTLTGGLSIDVYGWNSFDIGFGFEF